MSCRFNSYSCYLHMLASQSNHWCLLDECCCHRCFSVSWWLCVPYTFLYLDLLLLHVLTVLHLLMPLQQKVQKERQAACHLLSTQWLHVCCSSFSLLVLLLTFRYVNKSGLFTDTHQFSDFKTAFIKDQLKDAKIITSMVAAAANSVVLFLMGQSTSKECFFNLK